jgi:hypothetical protein
MCIGPDTARLIAEGHLTDYEILLPESDLDVTTVRTTAGGDYSPTGLKAAVQESQLVGDVVETYARYAMGKRNVVFATDVQTAEDMAERFRMFGINAAAVTGVTQDAERARRVGAFRDGSVQVLVSVDIFDEGFDLPAIEVVQMARPTQSLGKYLQQIGRGLRRMDGKDKALIIDHVSNVRRHGLPDAPRVWSLADREKRKVNVSVEDWVEPVKRCDACLKAYPATSRACTFCGHEPVPIGTGRSIKEVEGDLALLTGEALDALRAAAVLEAPADVGARAAHLAGPGAGAGASARQRERIATQEELKHAVAVWAGHLRHAGKTDAEIHRTFYFLYGMSILDALAMKRADMIALIGRLKPDAQ